MWVTSNQYFILPDVFAATFLFHFIFPWRGLRLTQNQFQNHFVYKSYKKFREINKLVIHLSLNWGSCLFLRNTYFELHKLSSRNLNLKIFFIEVGNNLLETPPSDSTCLELNLSVWIPCSNLCQVYVRREINWNATFSII